MAATEALAVVQTATTEQIMPRPIGMCGISFSGKTTLALKIASRLDAVHVSLDAINEERDLHGGRGIAPEEWEKTSHLASDRAQECLLNNRDVVLDDTLCFRWLRERYAAVAKRANAEFVLVYVATPTTQIYESMAKNELARLRHPIRREVFEEHARTFEEPAPDERAKVFDRSGLAEDWLETHFGH